MNWAYIAGFFDGEGCAGLYGGGKSSFGNVCATVSQNNIEVLQRISEFLSQYAINSKISTKKTPGKLAKRCISVLVIGANRDKLLFLSKIFPYLIVKKLIVQDIIRYRQIFPEIRGRVYAQVCSDAAWKRKRMKQADPLCKCGCGQPAHKYTVQRNGHDKFNRFLLYALGHAPSPTQRLANCGLLGEKCV